MTARDSEGPPGAARGASSSRWQRGAARRSATERGAQRGAHVVERSQLGCARDEAGVGARRDRNLERRLSTVGGHRTASRAILVSTDGRFRWVRTLPRWQWTPPTLAGLWCSGFCCPGLCWGHRRRAGLPLSDPPTRVFSFSTHRLQRLQQLQLSFSI